MLKGAYLRQGFYKNAMRQYEVMVNEIEGMKRKKVKLSDITEYKNTMISTIETELKTGYEQTLSDIRNKESELKHKYATQREYVDPQLEMLQRQDWDLKLSSMNDNQIENYICDDLTNNNLTVYQFGTLKNRVKAITSPSISKDMLERTIMTYELTKNVGEEYKNTDEYSELMQLQKECVNYGSTYLWKNNILEDKNELIDFRNTAPLLEGYDVNYSF